MKLEKYWLKSGKHSQLFPVKLYFHVAFKVNINVFWFVYVHISRKLLVKINNLLINVSWLVNLLIASY